MLIDEVVTELLLRWEDKPSLTPEELCHEYKDSPEYPALLEAVQQEIRHLQAANSFLDTSQENDSDPQALPSESPSREHGSSPDTPAPWTAPGLRYRPLSFHAKGGLGEVFRAEDEELHREVALKRIQERHRDNPESHSRFLREAEITAKLQHPGIVPVLGLGHDDQGRPCYAMRFIEGGTLDDAIKRFHEAEHQSRRDPGERSLALRELLNRFIAVCNTVAYAHSRGIVHRDLKSGNIMLGDYGETLVVDWGLAKPFARTEVERSTGEETLMPSAASAPGSTQLGLALGTPAYMSPEQAEGRWGVVGPASDIFSLGATLYALLTGQAPYQGRNAEEVLSKARRGDFPPPRQVKKDVPRALEATCVKAMAREQEKRYRTAKELAADVEQWLADEPVTAYLEPMPTRLWRWGRRHKPAIAGLAGALLTVLLLGGGGFGWWQWQRTANEQAATLDLQKAEEVLEQNRNPSEAGYALDRAEARLSGGGPAHLRERMTRLRNAVALVTKLESIRLKRATISEGRFDTATADREYAETFQAEALGEVGEDSAAVAARILNSAASRALVAALDDWAGCANEKSRRAWLLEVARRADPDPERDRLRDPAVWNDGTALAQLANPKRAAEWSPHLLVVVGVRLMVLGSDAEPLLRASWEQYPSDFWVNFKLGLALSKSKPEEAVGYYRAAMALRPGTLAVYNNLGVALYDLHRLEEAIAEYYKAIALDPKYASPHNNLGLTLYDLHRLDEAIAEYQKAIALNPKDAVPHNNLGNALRDLHRLDEAIAEYQKAIALNPKDAVPHNNLGLALYDLHRLDEAIAEYHKAIALDPKFAMPHNNLGNALSDLHRLDEAIAEYQKAIALDPKFALPHNNLGDTLRDLHRLDEAIAELHKAIALDPKFAAPHNNLGNALRDLHRLDEAIAEYQKAIALDPKDAWPHNGLGNALHDLHRLDEAIAEYQKAIALDPKYAWPHNDLGNALRALHRLDEAIAEYQKAIALDPKYAMPHYNLGNALRDLHRLDEAIAEYQKAIALDPKEASPHNNLGVALYDLHRLEEAIAEYYKAIALDPKYASPHNNLGNALRDLNRLDEAVVEYRKAIALDPKDASPHNNLGMALHDLHRLEEAIAEYHKAIAVDPKYARPHRGLGLALYDLHRLEEAIAEFQKAIALDPKYAWPHNDLGNALRALHRLDEAIAEYQNAIALDPKDAWPHNGLGNALSAQHRLDEAIAEYHKAIALDPKLALPHNGLGNALYDLHRLDEAVAEYQKAIALDPKYASPHNNLGNALRDLNRLDEAVVEYQKAIALDPKEAVTRGNLVRALLQQGEFIAARRAAQRWLELLPANRALHQRATQLLRQCDQMIVLDKKLASILKGESKAADADEQCALARLCQIKKRYAAAARFFTGAFAAQSKLANDLQAGHRYDAACFAALAAAGQGEDAAKLDDKERARLRQQALTWLRANLTAWSKALATQPDKARADVQRQMQHWQKDTDLASVRDRSALAKLPESERQQWHKLWDDVEALRQRGIASK